MSLMLAARIQNHLNLRVIIPRLVYYSVCIKFITVYVFFSGQQKLRTFALSHLLVRVQKKLEKERGILKGKILRL
jgi:hypothetical protein